MNGKSWSKGYGLRGHHGVTHGGRGYGYPQRREIKSLLEDNEVDKILNLTDENAEFFVEKAEKCAKEFAKSKVGISNTKLRNFYDYVKDMDKYEKVKLHLLRPRIAYTVGKEDNKEKKEILEEFQKTMEKLINKTNNENFDNFKNFFEAIVAYHKMYGGK